MKIITKNESETIEAGCQFGKILTSGAVVLLFGEMGAGKTMFTKGIAKSLGIKEEILSPTFTIMNEYRGHITLRHFDCYRLKSALEAVAAGLEECINDKDAVSVIEWYQNIEEILPKKNIKNVKISYVKNDGINLFREIEIDDE